MTSTPDVEVSQVFGALADATRRELIEMLGRRPACSASTLAGALPVSRQAVVQHLAVLERAGLVSHRKVGREVLFTVHPGVMEAAANWLTSRASMWQDALRQLKGDAEGSV